MMSKGKSALHIIIATVNEVFWHLRFCWQTIFVNIIVFNYKKTRFANSIKASLKPS